MKLQIHILTGHLTATNKRHITELFKLKMMQAKVNRINYSITEKGHNLYSVSMVQNLTTTIGGNCKPVSYKATFTVKN